MMTKKVILLLILKILVHASIGDDLYISNNLCLQYISNNQISPSANPGECGIICKVVNRQKVCATKDLSCVTYASYIFQSPQALNGNFYCNVLPYISEINNNRPSPDETRVCNTYKKSLPHSPRETFCQLTCGYLYMITSKSSGYEKKFQCDLQNNFVGCQGLKTFIQSQAVQAGSFGCEIYNHGDNFNYNRISGSNNGGGNTQGSSGGNQGSNGNTYPSYSELLTSGVQNFVNTGVNIIRLPFQFG